MKHVIISDTHSPKCIEKAYNYVKELLSQSSSIDAVVINGDLLGIFSMTSSVIHKNQKIPKQELLNYLELAAPRYFNKYKDNPNITPQMILEYVAERYQWCVNIIERFSKLNYTIFNMGNHESPNHFLVLNELPFLTGCNPSIIENVDRNILYEIFKHFEQKLMELEKTGQFKYIRNEPFVHDNTLILGIPGESHSTTGNDPNALLQEQKTKELIQKALQHINQVSSIIIYNHTQGDFDRETGKFHTASPSLKQFMNTLPVNILRRIYIQSHNHWNHSQFMINQGFNFILNNAGLHDGIFNIISFDVINTNCYDIDPNLNKIIPLKLSLNQEPVSQDQIIHRYYDDPQVIKSRKNAYHYLNSFSL